MCSIASRGGARARSTGRSPPPRDPGSPCRRPTNRHTPAKGPARAPCAAKRPSQNGVYALDESRNKIVGWIGCDQASGGCDAQINQTYVLDLTTRVWALGPGPTAPHPHSTNMATYIPLYDRVRQRVLILASSDGTQVWWYDDEAIGPPPGVPTAPTNLHITEDPAPPATPSPLSITTTGPGTGTTTGAGTWPAGTVVALGATPASGSRVARRGRGAGFPDVAVGH